jgi:conjugative transfer signal peptidase TraF
MNARSKRLRTKAAVLAGISVAAVLSIVALAPHAPIVVYNGSGSAPLGFYRVENRLPERGEMAVIQPPPLVELMLVARGILPPSVPLLKQIAAVGGDEVCRSDEPIGMITVNGKAVAETFEKDRDGRLLPAWKGCLKLVDGEFFLLQPHPFSFDSRYFGPVMRCDILGVARPVWTWNPPG